MLDLRTVLLAMVVASPALAQNLRVLPVPVASNDPTSPHAAYNGHATTFKAIARGGNGTYLVEWDFDGDGTIDSSRTVTNRYDLSARYTYPSQASDADFVARVRVTSSGQTVTGSYPVHVFSEVPSDPNNATNRQLQVMRAVAVDDALWFLHNQMTRSGDEADPLTGARATGSLSGAEPALAEGDFLEALGRNGHFVAFPPAYAGAMRDPTGNAERFNLDPYAEDAFRVVNSVLGRLQAVTVSTNLGNTQGAPNDESNATGFFPEVLATPIPGTDDGIGLYVAGGSLWTGHQAAGLRGLASVRLGGYTAQFGDQNRVLGRAFPFVVQQMVDALVWAQNDAGSYPGSYYYTPNANSDWLGEFGAGALNAAEALLWTEQSMALEGVIVPNIAKTRFVSYAFQIAENCPAGGRGATMQGSGSGMCDVALSAFDTLVLGWMKGNQYLATDTLFAFPGYSNNSNPTRGQLRSFFDANQLFVGNVFLALTPASIGWDYGFVEGGDFSRIDGKYDLWTMLHWARAARAVGPEIVTFGVHDWERQFTRILINSQAADGSFNWVLSALNSYNDNIVGPAGRAAWAVHLLSPDDQRPLALVRASPPNAPEGSSVLFSSTAMVHDAADWSWALGNGATRTGASFSYAFPDDGAFTVTGTATTAGGTSSHSTVVTVTNVAPTVSAGADVTVTEGTPVSFVGTFTDPGVDDPHTFLWQFGDATTAATLSASHPYADNGVFNASLRVNDDDGFGVDTAQVTVTNVGPTITSTPPIVAIAGRALSYTLTFTDPGVVDTHTCSGTAPAGGTFASCVLTWTPGVAQAGTAVPLQLCVSDDDGAQTCQAFQVTVTTPPPNQLPGAPTLDSPNGTQVSSLQPTLQVSNATDPENDPLTYEFEVFQGTARVASATNVATGMGTTSWQVSVMLTENAQYAWHARAVSATGPGPWSATGTFVVNTANSAPPPPTVLSPGPGALVDTLTPTLAFLPWGDPDGDALTFDWQLASDEAFTALIDTGTGVTATQIVPGVALTEDARVCWRVRASDGQAQSAWSRACFRVSAVDGPPTVPVLLAPAANAVVSSTQPVFAWTGSVDPEGAVVTYELEVSEGSTTLATVDGLGGTATVLAQPLVDGRTYAWRVRAKSGGAASAFTATSSFTVSLPDAGSAGGGGGATGGGGGATGGGGGTTGDDGGTTGGGGGATGGGGGATGGGGGATGGGGGTTGDDGGATGGGGGDGPPPAGCGCSALPGAELAGLALLALVRRRASRR